MKPSLPKLLFMALLLLGGFLSAGTFALTDPVKEGGIGGTGAVAHDQGVGGAEAAKIEGGIGGTGLRPNDESALKTLVGRVMFIAGQVSAENLGVTRLLAKGDPVRAGDTLTSAAEASVQLRMSDGGTIALRQQSQLLIESYAYKGIQDGSEHISLALINGGFRAVTGNIGHLHKENYRIRTPNATIGILGTDHETIFVPQAPLVQSGGLEPGTYNHVFSGATTLQNKQGKLLINPNQTGFAGLSGSIPNMFDKPLSLFTSFNDSLPERSEHQNNSHDAGDKQAASDSQGYANLKNSLTHSEHLTQTDRLGNSSIDLNTMEKDAKPATPLSAIVGAQVTADKVIVGSAQAGNTGETLYVSENKPGNYANNSTGFNFVKNENSTLEKGTAQIDGFGVTWGVYEGGTAFDVNGNAVSVRYHPFALVEGGVTPPSVVAAMSGSVNYSKVAGFTSPLNEAGDLGGNLSLSVDINLGSSKLTGYNLLVTDANGRNWAGTLDSSVSLSTFSQTGAPLAVTCAGSTCGSGTGTGLAVGKLIGTNAKGLISSYGLSTASGQSVAGAAVLSRP